MKLGWCYHKLKIDHTCATLHLQDLLGYFRRDPLGESVFDMRTWDIIYETLLRNKANMIIPGTSPNPDEPSLTLASRRGLTLSQSHFEIVNFEAREWQKRDVAPRELYNWATIPTSWHTLGKLPLWQTQIKM